MKIKMITVTCLFLAISFALSACTGLPAGRLDDRNRTNVTEEQTPKTAESETGMYPFPFEFTAKDLYGNDVTAETLGEKEIFFLHLWATWCPPCVAEMGELAEIAEMYDENVGFLGLLSDYADNLRGAIRLTEQNNVGFINIPDRTRGLEAALRMLSTGFVPTTVLIDKDGNIIGEPLIGAHGLGYAKYIDEALEIVRSK